MTCLFGEQSGRASWRARSSRGYPRIPLLQDVATEDGAEPTATTPWTGHLRPCVRMLNVDVDATGVLQPDVTFLPAN